MGLLDKVKNFFYDDEEIEEEEEEIEVPVRVRHKEKKAKQIEVKEEVSERELFRAERTFNFPMDVDDDTIIAEPKPIIKEEVKEEVTKNIDIPSYREVKPRESIYTGLRAYSKMERNIEPEVKKEEPKKFRPTPVISPIFGVLDKNYKKEDIVVNSDEYENVPKKVDYDSVRKRAYGNIYKTEEVESESEPEEETKGIFYNLDEEVEENEEITVNNIDDEFDDNEEVKIIYNDVTFDEEETNEISEEESYEEENEDVTDEEIDEDEIDNVQDDENILSETKEQDLFNLIDNMYNSDDEEEEEEE